MVSLSLLLPPLVAFLSATRTEAFGLNVPQPAGLSPELVASLARKRYGGHDDGRPMHGRVVVITGAAGGIGRELVRAVHGLGGTVLALDRNVTGLDLLFEELSGAESDGGADGGVASSRVICLPTRHEDLGSVSRSAEEIRSMFDSVDLLVNNAGLTYPPGSAPGQEGTTSAHGDDLAFTVNYLSHFLLTEKLLPRLRTSDRGRVVHVTSTYHFKVDGSEIAPTPDGGGPAAHRSDPAAMSPMHVERSYANTKLAQIWHSRTLRGCPSVCACPTWAGTGIGGEANRAFLERFAFPAGGAGIASTLNAMFRTDDELGDALSRDGRPGRSIVANSRTLEYLPFKEAWTSRWVTDMGWRDGIVDFAGLVLLFGQRFTFEEFIVQRSSRESYEDRGAMEALYEWSLEEVGPWL